MFHFLEQVHIDHKSVVLAHIGVVLHCTVLVERCISVVGCIEVVVDISVVVVGYIEIVVDIFVVVGYMSEDDVFVADIVFLVAVVLL